MTWRHRVAKLEAGAGFGLAPPAVLIYAEGTATAYLRATGERLVGDAVGIRVDTVGHPVAVAIDGHAVRNAIAVHIDRVAGKDAWIVAAFGHQRLFEAARTGAR